ncbi:MAG: PAS domain S-box protein [Deltaproteobacteria bacterium]|nr:PAS domain S-box protein [Deltaproteobacteria bacterium]
MIDEDKTKDQLIVELAELRSVVKDLRESEKRFRLFVEHSKDAFYLHKRSGKIIDANKHACEILGYTLEELLTLSIQDVDQEINLEKHLERWKQMVHGEPITLEGVHRRKDGTTFPVEVRLVWFESGEEQYMLGLVRDITRRKLMEEELRERTRSLERSNRELEQFAYVASHDLQEPLRMVASYTQLLAKRYKDKLDSDADEFISYAVDGANRMQMLINDLLHFSRVGTKGKEFSMTGFDTVLEKTMRDLKKRIEENGAEVTIDSMPTLMADAGQIGQVFQNLISNAIKFRNAAPPEIHISSEKNGDNWIFSVSDNGIGIAPEYSTRIFEIFQRLHSKEEYPGSGIGLAICKKIVERHGGKIWIESEPSKGTTFYFTIPIQGEI